MLRRRSISLLSLTGLGFFGLASNRASANWDVRTMNGRKYVAIEGMRAFYEFDSLERKGRQYLFIKSDKTPRFDARGKRLPPFITKVTLSTGSNECLMNGVKFVFSYDVIENGGRAWMSMVDLSKLVDPVLRPNYIANAGKFDTVILDPGHGGKDPGATNNLGTEAGYNLDVAERTRKLLLAKGYKVVMTRDSNRFISLQERVNFANRIQSNAIFISIHHNSSSGGSARGFETFTLSPIGVSHYGRGLNGSDFQQRTGNFHDSANVALATAVHGRIGWYLKNQNSFDRGIKRARFSVLTGVRHPAILLECGFMTHPYEAKAIHTENYRNTIAQSITEAIVLYSKAVGRKTTPTPKP